MENSSTHGTWWAGAVSEYHRRYVTPVVWTANLQAEDLVVFDQKSMIEQDEAAVLTFNLQSRLYRHLEIENYVDSCTFEKVEFRLKRTERIQAHAHLIRELEAKRPVTSRMQIAIRLERFRLNGVQDVVSGNEFIAIIDNGPVLVDVLPVGRKLFNISKTVGQSWKKRLKK